MGTSFGDEGEAGSDEGEEPNVSANGNDADDSPMREAVDVLYGKFPRAVGVETMKGDRELLRQFPTHSRSEFDVFRERVRGVKDPYASISWEDWDHTHYLDKVSIDLDSPLKNDWEEHTGRDPPDDVKISLMRENDELARNVLDPVLEDGRKIAERAREQEIPALGVFSGFGLHVHLLFQETSERLEDKLETTALKWVRELNLDTLDGQVSGDYQRVLRIPNSKRMAGSVDDARFTGLYTIPLSRDELETATATGLLERSRTPREDSRFEIPANDDRPVMEVHEDFLRQSPDYEEVDGQREVGENILDTDDGDRLLDFFLREWLRMPCMYERIKQSKPDRFVRFNCAVLLFNVGFDPVDVSNIFRRIGWVDYDRDVTMNQLEHIYKSGYADASCEKIRKKGLCVLDQRDWERCPCYEWSGGRAEWK